jgi:hypothetical protein
MPRVNKKDTSSFDALIVVIVIILGFALVKAANVPLSVKSAVLAQASKSSKNLIGDREL